MTKLKLDELKAKLTFENWQDLNKHYMKMTSKDIQSLVDFKLVKNPLKSCQLCTFMEHCYVDGYRCSKAHMSLDLDVHTSNKYGCRLHELDKEVAGRYIARHLL